MVYSDDWTGLTMDGSENMTAKDFGSAVVFFHTVNAQAPASLVRAVAIGDLRSSNPGGLIRERGFCQARVLDRWLPCIVIEMNELRSLDEEIVKVLEDEIHLERRGENIAMEFGFSRVPRTDVLGQRADVPPTRANHQLPTAYRTDPVRSPEIPAPNANTASTSSSPQPSTSDSTSGRSSASAPRKSTKAVALFRDAMHTPSTIVNNEAREVNATSGMVSQSQNVGGSRQLASSMNALVGRGDDDGDVIYKMSHTGFFSANVHPKRPVPPAPKLLADLPATIFSHHYNKHIKVTDLRHGMWQRNSWQEAANEALHCLFSDDELVTSVPSKAGAIKQRKKMLDPTKFSLIFALSKELSKEWNKTVLDWHNFGKHVGTHKSILRGRLGLPRRRKRPNAKKEKSLEEDDEEKGTVSKRQNSIPQQKMTRGEMEEETEEETEEEDEYMEIEGDTDNDMVEEASHSGESVH